MHVISAVPNLFSLLFYSISSVSDPDPGSRIQCLLTPGSGISFFQISILDLGSQIPIPYFRELSNNVWVKCTIILSKLAQIFFFTCSNKLFSILAIKKGRTTKFTPSSSVAVVGSRIRIRDPGSEIYIPFHKTGISCTQKIALNKEIKNTG